MIWKEPKIFSFTGFQSKGHHLQIQWVKNQLFFLTMKYKFNRKHIGRAMIILWNFCVLRFWMWTCKYMCKHICVYVCVSLCGEGVCDCGLSHGHNIKRISLLQSKVKYLKTTHLIDPLSSEEFRRTNIAKVINNRFWHQKLGFKFWQTSPSP